MNRLRLVTFDHIAAKVRKIGVQVEKHVVDLCAADASLPRDMKSFLSATDNVYSKALKIVESGKHRIPSSEVQLRAPIYNPEKIVCVGLNYVDHAKESNMALPSEPILFSKYPNTIVGTNDNVIKPNQVTELDYEAELVIVMGKEAKDVSEADAMKHIAGYTVGNDVSAREWQLKKAGGQWMLGKTWDTFAPIGPAITVNPLLLGAAAATLNPNNLGIRAILNGNTVQNSNTKEFVFGVEKVVAYISKIMTLKPGDLIFTGTPPGVGFGRKPQVWMQVGDKIRIEIDELGEIENTIVAPSKI
eukprot:TRINITY_DN3507_c0_g1_i1.p1 TRINITY_DN3507_c0_g1~~TRINITY_DN3507_c0_g1_i1.p1  ORF type:complete len:302 (-),score=95.11 TRINITY_DN3507_c0_g1_i1:30-935(-)